MSKKIYGDKSVIERVKQSKPGDKATYISWEAINELPEEYEVVISEIKFNAKKLDEDFANVGTDKNPSWMPSTQIMYRIAEACGISGGEKSIVEPIIEEVDINPMLMKPIEDEPTYRKMKTGEKVVKYATRLQEDGTPLRSSPCTSEYNVWERCLEMWAKEELYTEGYTKQGKFPSTYNTPHKRRYHFQSELKFAHAKAETKAYTKAIRELAGLQTGYRTEDLKEGRLIFARVRRSREVLRMETAARLQALGKDRSTEKLESEKLLFGTNEESIIDNTSHENANKTEATSSIFEVPDEKNKIKSNREIMIDVLKKYLEDDLIVQELIESAQNILKWLSGNEQAESDQIFWPKAIGIIKEIEAKIPEEGKLNHDLY